MVADLGEPVQASLYAASVTIQPASVLRHHPVARDRFGRPPAAQRTPTASPEPTPPRADRDPRAGSGCTSAPPARTAEAPAPAPAAPAPDAAPADDTRNKPRIHLDGERSEISFDGDKGSLQRQQGSR